MNIELTKHQINSLYLLKNRTDLPYVFLIGGFGCGKSFTDVMVVMWLYSIYYKSTEPICIGIIGVTIKLLKQTVLADVERMFDAAGIPYRDNSQAGTLTVGNITFVYLAMSDPDAIYAFNFHAAIVDEMDEVPAEKVKKIVTAIQERCRKRMPVPLDRDPFIFFSTTAQGLGGTYQLVK
jgi:phage terminase large subunit-like protein